MALNPKPSASPLIAHLIPVPLTFIPAIVHHYYICIDISIIHSPHLSILPVHSFLSSHSFPSCPHAHIHHPYLFMLSIIHTPVTSFPSCSCMAIAWLCITMSYSFHLIPRSHTPCKHTHFFTTFLSLHHNHTYITASPHISNPTGYVSLTILILHTTQRPPKTHLRTHHPRIFIPVSCSWALSQFTGFKRRLC